MIDIDRHHLGGAPGCAAGLDGARRAVADLEEAHEAGGAAATRQLLVLAAQFGEIGAGARAVFEQPRLAHPEVHDAALVDEVVGDRLDEAGMRLRMLISAVGGRELAGLEIDVVVALRRPVDAIGPMEPGVEPLRRVGRRHLAAQHEAHLVVIGARIGVAVEIPALPAPIGPGAGETVEHLARALLRAEALADGQRLERGLVGGAPP